MSRRKPRRVRQSISALDTLAEVSRHHRDISDSAQTSVNYGRQQDASGGNTIQDDEVMTEHYLVQVEKGLGEDLNVEMVESDTPVNIDLGRLPSPSEIFGSPEHVSTSYQLPCITAVESDSTVTSSSASASPMNLTSSAAASSQILIPSGSVLEPNISSPNASISDKCFGSRGCIDSLWPIQTRDSVLQNSKRSTLIGGLGLQAGHHEQLRLLNAHDQIGDDVSVREGDLSDLKKSKGKARCKFSDERRKEVQEVRKRGACIRCRMLKKPCSNENPCSTCIGVESARLWKQPCVRTRIADELTFFTAGLKQAMASHAMRQISSRAQHDILTDKIKATHFGVDDYYVILAAQKACHPSNAILSPCSLEATKQCPYSSNGTILLDMHDKSLADKIEEYIHTTSIRACGLGTSNFMNITCDTLKSLMLDKKSIFISQILDLWTATQILTSSSLQLTIYSCLSSTNCSSSSYSPTSASNSLKGDTIQTEISPSEQPESYKIITLQLLAMIEKHAAKLGKVIMNELERRLLQRRQTSPLETFLVAIILLACVGQMAWYFRKCELNCDGNGTTQNSEGSWLLDKPASHYIEQSEQLRDLLLVLLKTRGIPSKSSSKGSGCSSNLSKSKYRNRKRKAMTEEASQYEIDWKNADSGSSRDEIRDMIVDGSSDKLRSTSSSSWTSTVTSSIIKDGNAMEAGPSQSNSSPQRISDDQLHHRHKEIEDRWYAAVRDVVLNDGFVMHDAPAETMSAIAAGKKGDKVDVGMVNREIFDSKNPHSWELKYIGALLKLGV